jgi:acyl dehydratase
MGVKATDLAIGDSREAVLVEDLTRTRIVQYAGASGDYNPLHTDELFARESAGFPSVFAHGMLTMAMTGRVVTDWVGAGRLTHYGARFVGQVWPGDDLIATATVEAIRAEEGVADFSLVTRNQRGENVLTGTASARLD